MMMKLLDCLLIGYALYELHDFIDMLIAFMVVGKIQEVMKSGESDGRQ